MAVGGMVMKVQSRGRGEEVGGGEGRWPESQACRVMPAGWLGDPRRAEPTQVVCACGLRAGSR
jgi:hypothetical protein